MVTVAIILAVIVVIIGIFRWKRATENPVETMARQSRKMYAERNGEGNRKEIFDLVNEPFDLSFSLDPAGEDD